MLKITLISLLLLSKVAFSQLTEHFTDGDFSQNPTWQGDIAYFQVNTAKQLQSKGQQIASQNYTLCTANESDLNARWSFLVQLNFDPTATNFTRIYLSSNQADLKSPLNGYFIQIGEAGTTDGVHLYRQSGNTLTRIITGPQHNRSNANLMLVRILVSRDVNGKWTLSADHSGGNNYALEGNAVDLTFTGSAFMGIYCKYATASRYNQFIFDDFIVEDLVPDNIPPVLTKITVTDSTHLNLIFSEALDATSALALFNYDLSGGYGHPESAALLSPNVIRLTYPRPLTTNSYLLTLDHVEDKKGNKIVANSTHAFFYIRPYFAKYGDLIINEIFANPTGSPGIPQKEFVELWNRSGEYILTRGWKYADAGSTSTFPADTIKPGAYIILCAKADTGLFKPYGKTIGLSPWPSLNNDKDLLSIFDDSGNLIDRVAYTDAYYQDELKRKGGYSLELVDPQNICQGMQNWLASKSVSGATPAVTNSVFQSQLNSEKPRILSVKMLDSVYVDVVFSKALDSLSAVQTAHYLLNNGIGHPIQVEVAIPAFKSARLTFANPLERGIEHTFTVSNLNDCAGNLVETESEGFKLFRAKPILKNDILISEVLFNPKPGAVDFVEIYNNTDHELDLADLQFGNADQKGNVSNFKNAASSTTLIKAGMYWVLTTNEAKIRDFYMVEAGAKFSVMSSLPAYNNDKGSVILKSGESSIDQFNYTEKMHHPLLRNADGVSLERVSFQKGCNEPGNFKSAAASVGFATPGSRNSQENSGEVNFVKLLSKTFSPDDDGFEDVLKMEYQFSENASLATVQVFTEKGILVRKLVQNQTVATKGSFVWNGLDDQGTKAGIGVYIVLVDLFNLQGRTQKFKSVCVVANKLN